MSYLVYQHRRSDNDEIFYIGISNNNDRPTYKFGRSEFWNRIVDKYGYKVEIVCTCETREEACQIEQYLIKFYGRRNLGLGSLVNLTDGGEGVTGLNHSEESRKKISESKKGHSYRLGKKHSEETKRKIGRSRRESSVSQGLEILDTFSGIYYDTIAEAAEAIGIKRTTLNAMLKGQNPNKTNLQYV